MIIFTSTIPFIKGGIIIKADILPIKIIVAVTFHYEVKRIAVGGETIGIETRVPFLTLLKTAPPDERYIDALFSYLKCYQ